MQLVATCVETTQSQWEKYMEGSTQANYTKIHSIIHKNFPEYNWITERNPYCKHYRKKDNMLILVHSAIEYFFEIN